MSIYKRMAEEVKSHWVQLAFAVACMLIVAGTTAGLAYILGPVVDDIFVAGVTDPQRARKMILILPLALVAIMWLKGGATYFQTVLMVMVGQKIVADLRERIYAHLQELSLSFYDNTQTGLLVARMTNDVNLLRESVSSALAAAFRDLFTIFGLIFLVFFRDWRLAIIAMFVFPLAMVPFIKFGQWVRNISTRNQQATAEMANQMTETITGARVVKAFTAEDHETSRFKAISQRILGLHLKEERIRALSSPTMESLGAVAFAVILGYGGHRVLTGAASAGTFVSFIAAVIMLYDPLKKLARTWTIVQRGAAAAERIYSLLDTQAAVADRPGARELDGFERTIEFKGVGFSYGREPVLKGIDLTIEAGKIVALAGASGGGKTTLVNLLPRFYDLETGEIKIDGTDIRDLTLKSLRRHIGLVTQQTILFRRHHPGQHLLRPPRGRRGGGDRGGQGGLCPRFHNRAAGRLSDPDRGAGGPPLRGPAPEAGHRPGPLEGRPHPDLGRGHLLPGHGIGVLCPEGHRQPHGGADHPGHRPPPLDHLPRR